MNSAINLADITDGRIQIWRGSLTEDDRLRRYLGIIHQAIGKLVSKKAGEAVVASGIESLHRHVDATDLRRLTDSLSRRMRCEAKPFFNWLLQHLGIDSRSTIFYAPEAWVRLMAPEAYTRPHADHIGHYYGHLVAHDPHRDSWFSQATNVVNLWIALGRVSLKNGLLLYPTEYGKTIETVGGRLPKRYPLGPPLQISLEAGDMLIFHGEHLHSSALNLTEETRVVLSFRLTLGEPSYAREDNRYQYVRWRLARDSSRVAKTSIRVEELTAGRNPDESAVFVVTRGVGCVQSESATYLFSSRCPHRGADLSVSGYFDKEDLSIRCAWHNLSFSLETGNSPLCHLAKLKVRKCYVNSQPVSGRSIGDGPDGQERPCFDDSEST